MKDYFLLIGETLNHMYYMRQHLLQTLGRGPAAQELARGMKMDVEKVEALLIYNQQVASLESLRHDEGQRTVGDDIEDGTMPDIATMLVNSH